MTAKEVAAIITAQRHLFQISIPGSPACFGKKTIEEALADSPSLEEYFELIAERNKARELIVRTFVRNGTSFKEKGMYLIAFAPDIAVVDEHQQPSTTEDEEETAFRNPRSTNEGLYGPDPNHPAIRAGVLEVKLDFAERDAKQWKDRAEKAEKEWQRLYEENTKLLREAAISDGKHEMDKQRAISETKGGLSGFMEEVKSLPPEGWQFLAGCFPNHPMARQIAGDSAAPVCFHSDTDANSCIQGINEALKAEQPEVVGMIALITNKLLESPIVRTTVYNKLFPSKGSANRQQQETTTETTV